MRTNSVPGLLSFRCLVTAEWSWHHCYIVTFKSLFPWVLQSQDGGRFLPPNQLASLQVKSNRPELTLPQWFLSWDIKEQLVEVHIGLVLQWEHNTGITTHISWWNIVNFDFNLNYKTRDAWVAWPIRVQLLISAQVVSSWATGSSPTSDSTIIGESPQQFLPLPFSPFMFFFSNK